MLSHLPTRHYRSSDPSPLSLFFCRPHSTSHLGNPLEFSFFTSFWNLGFDALPSEGPETFFSSSPSAGFLKLFALMIFFYPNLTRPFVVGSPSFFQSSFPPFLPRVSSHLISLSPYQNPWVNRAFLVPPFFLDFFSLIDCRRQVDFFFSLLLSQNGDFPLN